jgi:hypothetical protein
MNPENIDPYSSIRLSRQRQHEMYESYSKHYMPYCHRAMNQECKQCD